MSKNAASARGMHSRRNGITGKLKMLCHARTIFPVLQTLIIYQDKFFSNMRKLDWIEATAPKIEGSYNLSQLLPPGLDFIVFLSSLVGIAGAVGQSNYAAGCAFQDALAHQHSTVARKCVSIDLGMVIDAGAVSEDESLQRTMESFGHYQPMHMSHLEKLLQYYCHPNRTSLSVEDSQIVCGIRRPSTLEAMGFKQPGWMKMPMFRGVLSLQSEDTLPNVSMSQLEDYQESLQQARSIADAASVIIHALLRKLSDSLGVTEADLDTSRPVHLYGVDSLVAVELRNWFANKIKADVAVLHILGDSSIEDLASMAVRSSIYTRAWRINLLMYK